MVANKPGHQGEREISRKTIARGMPGVSGVTVVTNARVFYTTRAAAGASGARHSLRPLLSEGAKLPAKLGRIAPREGGVMYLDRHAPLQAGHPVRRGVSYEHEPSLEYWIARSSGLRRAEPVIGPRFARIRCVLGMLIPILHQSELMI